MLKFLALDALADVHRNGINGIRAVGLRIAKGGTYGIERSQLRLRPESSLAELEAERLRGSADVKSRIEFHEPILTEARMVAHFLLDPEILDSEILDWEIRGRTLYFSTAAG